MTTGPAPQETQTFDQLVDNHDAALDGIIKEIKDLTDDSDTTNDKIESNLIVGDQLNNGLKNYLENNKNVATLLINGINSINTSNLGEDVKNSLQKLVALLSGVVSGPVEGNESVQEVANPSFDKFRKMIEEGKLNKLNTLKDREVQDVINFVNDSKNDISSLNLFADMFNQQALHGGDRNFKRTDRKNFYDVFNAVKSHFNMPEGDGVDKAKDIQLGKIFEGKSTKDDLSKIAKDYLGVDNWDGNNLEQKSDGKFAEGVKLIVDYAKFVDKFNELNGVRIASETPATPDATPAVETPEAVGNGGFEKVDNVKDGLVIGSINGYISSKLGEGKDILRYGKDGYECNMDNVKEFLGKISNGEIKFDKNFISVKSDSRKAWLSSVQLLFNSEKNSGLVVDGKYVKGGETYNAVKKFQGEYNESKKVDGKYPDGFKPLVEDGIPGPLTLGKMLEDKPVAEPTGEPAAEPTGEPAAEPTGEPVAEPIGEPAAEPTGEPVAEPTGEPVAEPTGEPVAEPTGEPAAEEEWHPPMAAPEDQAHTNDGEYTRGNNQTRVGNGWTKPRGTS